MDFAWIGFDREVDINQVCLYVMDKFNLKECHEYDWEKFDDLEEILKRLGLNTIMENHISAFYKVLRNDSEFPLVLEFSFLKDLPMKVSADIYVAYKLSVLLQCKTITDGTTCSEKSSPYWDVIFDKGQAFLADDFDSKFCDAGDNIVEIMREITLEELGIIDIEG